MDSTLLRQRIGMIWIVGTQWFTVAAAPFAAVGRLGHFGSSEGWVLVLLAAITGYCFYTGYRAWKRKWKARFILRIVVPAVLFVLSCVLAASGLRLD